MSENILVFSEEGEEIRVEIISDQDEFSGYRGEKDLTEKTATAQKAFQKALAPIKLVANKTLNTLNEIAESPEEVTLKMGLKFTGEANAVLTKVGGEANLEVTIKWTQESLSKARGKGKQT